jgi:CheY-like chemotaxis protein
LDITQVKKKHKILVVDDEKKVLIVARKILRSAGYDVEVCLGPEEAVEIVANRGPVAVLFTDNRMPGMRGTELLEQVKHLSPSTVRVLTTAYYDQQLIEDIVNKGEAFRFVKKPIDFNKVLKVIRECVEQFEVNKKSEDFQGSIKNLTQANQLLTRESEGLSESIRKLRKRIGLVAVVVFLIFAGAAGLSFFSEFQRQERLQQTSVTLGDWMVYDNGTALDSVNRRMWMTQDFRIIERRYPDTWEEARDWAQLMNAKRFGGYRDWRVPTIEEYKMTFDPDLTRLAFDKNKDYPVGYPKAFQDGGGYGFWSIEEVGGDSAKYFFFAGGYDKTEFKEYHSPTMSVRLVRTIK